MLSALEIGIDEFDNTYKEMRMWQMHKRDLLKGGEADDF